MNFRKHRLIAFSTLIILNVTSILCSCGRDEYRRCLMLADPLLKDPHLIYPDNLRDIDHVCRTWSQFVDCVKRYTSLCFTEHKRKEFEKAVESSISLVHEMCTSADYQTEYLIHAPCMRATLTDDLHCGRYYRQLVAQVTGEPATPALCCTHYRFRECVLDQTWRTCEQHATSFAKEIMDRAMGFLQDQCYQYKPADAECSGVVMADWTQPPYNNPDSTVTWQREDRRLTQQPPNDMRTWNPNGKPPDGWPNNGDTSRMPPDSWPNNGDTNRMPPNGWPNNGDPNRITQHGWPNNGDTNKMPPDGWPNNGDTNRMPPDDWPNNGDTNRMPPDNWHNKGDKNILLPTEASRTSHRRGMNFDPTEGGIEVTWKPSSNSSSSTTTVAITVADEPNQQGLANDSNSTASQFSPTRHHILYKLLTAVPLILVYFIRE